MNINKNQCKSQISETIPRGPLMKQQPSKKEQDACLHLLTKKLTLDIRENWAASAAHIAKDLL